MKLKAKNQKLKIIWNRISYAECLIIFLLSAFCILPCSAQSTIYSNDFNNWTAGMPDGWNIFTPTADLTVTQYTPAYTGFYSCKVENTQGQSYITMTTTETFSIYRDKKYVVSFAALLIYGNTGMELSLIDPNTGEISHHMSGWVTTVPGIWKNYELEFTTSFALAVDSCIERALSVRILGTGGRVEFIIDHVKLVAIDRTVEFDYLEANNIKAYIHPIIPFLNTDGINYFEAPKHSGKSTIFASNLWLGGIDIAEQLHVAAQKYCQTGRDFYLGPTTSQYNGETLFAEEYIQKYYHTWKVTKEEIEYHKAHYANSDYVMPWGIANWPAHGRTEYKESANLAPYKNVSGSNYYTPWLGDYPEIRGDEAIYFIISDIGPHTESGSNFRFRLEILGMAYSYNSPDPALQNTVFISYVLRNKSEVKTYYNFYFGFWLDFDIGHPEDDYVGCAPLLNLAYGYNGAEIDGQGQAWAYGAHPPAQGAMFLNQKMSAFVAHQNIPGPTGDPQIANDYYNYLQAKWKDGSPVTYGGNGYGGSIPTKFMYDGDPVTKTNWTELTPNGPGSTPNTPGDRRALMSAGPFTLHINESICVDIALPFARDYEGDHISSVALLKQYAQAIQQFYDQQNFENNCSNTIGIKENTIYKDKLLIYPNPSNGQFTATCEKVIESIELYDVLGKKVFADTPKAQTIRINTNLTKGLYIYRVLLQDNSTCSGKIVIQ